MSKIFLVKYSPPISKFIMFFWSAYPSCTGNEKVEEAPESKINAVALPVAKQDKTPPLQRKKFPTPKFSKTISVSFYLSFVSWIFGSLINKGWCEGSIPNWFLYVSFNTYSTKLKSWSFKILLLILKWINIFNF